VGLDPHSIRLLKDMLRSEAAGGMCVLMSTHTLGAAEEIAHRIGIMRRGRLLYDGSVERLRQEMSADGQSLEAMYLTLTEPAADVGRPEQSEAGR